MLSLFVIYTSLFMLFLCWTLTELCLIRCFFKMGYLDHLLRLIYGAYISRPIYTPLLQIIYRRKLHGYMLTHCHEEIRVFYQKLAPSNDSLKLSFFPPFFHVFILIFLSTYMVNLYMLIFLINIFFDNYLDDVLICIFFFFFIFNLSHHVHLDRMIAIKHFVWQ